MVDGAAAAQAVAAPPRPNPSARACRCHRRRRSTQCPCVVRDMLCVWQMASELGDGTRVACIAVKPPRGQPSSVSSVPSALGTHETRKENVYPLRVYLECCCGASGSKRARALASAGPQRTCCTTSSRRSPTARTRQGSPSTLAAAEVELPLWPAEGHQNGMCRVQSCWLQARKK